MFLNELERTFISNLKGRVSKILGIASRLKKAEKEGLVEIYLAIDKLILYKGEEAEKAKSNFKEAMKGITPVLEDTNKRYVKEHILPLVNKLGTSNWEKEK